MKVKLIYYILISIVLMLVLTGCSNDIQDENTTNKLNAERMHTNAIDSTNNTNVIEIKKNATGATEEITISEFSTKIYNKDSARQNNIKITCGKLSGSTVKAGETFSFETIVGKATTAERLPRG